MQIKGLLLLSFLPICLLLTAISCNQNKQKTPPTVTKHGLWICNYKNIRVADNGAFLIFSGDSCYYPWEGKFCHFKLLNNVLSLFAYDTLSLNLRWLKDSSLEVVEKSNYREPKTLVFRK